MIPMISNRLINAVKPGLVKDVVTTLPDEKRATRIVHKGTDLNYHQSEQLVCYIKNYLLANLDLGES